MAWDGKVWVRDPRIAFHKDVDPMLLNTPGGVVDLSSGLMRPHDADDRMTRMTAVAPDGQVKTPLWDRFMAEVTGGDPTLQSFLREVEGYLLTGLVHEHAMFFLWGEGGNGKSTYVGTLADILGSYHTVAAPDMLMAARYQAHPTELAAIRGARLVTASETEQGRHWAEAKVKAMTGGDRLTARFMREDFFEFNPTHKLVVVGNHKPMLYAVDTAIRRRFNLILFIAKIAAVILNFREELVAEWPGILHKMIQGCLLWQTSPTGLRRPECVVRATDNYMEAEDVRGAWMAERTERKGRTSFVQSDVLYADWRRWAEARGEQPGPMKALIEYIASHGIRQHKTMHARGFIGLALVGMKPLFSLEVVENKDENDEK
jgi:P4 family phage/plasmid primase-like protien